MQINTDENERENESSVYFVAGRLGNSYTRATSDLGRTEANGVRPQTASI